MKLTFLLLIVLLFTQCARRPKKIRLPEEASQSPLREKLYAPRHGVILELLSDGPLQLRLRNVSSGKVRVVELIEGVSLKQLPFGEWELVGLEHSGRRWTPDDHTRHFSFKHRRNKFSYGGSIVYRCPLLKKKDQPLLKQMDFFNRYSFISNRDMCEVIVGDNFKSVRKQLKQQPDDKKSPLIMGF